MYLITPKGFLTVGGVVLVLVGLLGWVLIGPTAENSIFGQNWWFDNGENVAHLLIGVVGLIAAFALPEDPQKWLVGVLGVVGVLIGIWSIFNPDFLGANLENPADTILHLVVGVWALASAMGKE